ncbi:MAG TPA: alpha/beta hydrolase fold domain-containing protein [Clostridiaceae bacterium]|jgi:monoterpene epsilon-lactone hydrolase|nr:alpha/beta hydrolase fold domain-containing protein [Clostridiaceae bacterium]
MKISNKIIMSCFRLLSIFFPDKPIDEIYAHAKAHNARQSFKLPNDKKIEYKDEKIHTDIGTYHCLRMKKKYSRKNGRIKKEQRSKRAVLFICGGGGVYDYCQMQLALAKKLLSHVDCEIYYPFYPPSTKHPIKEAFRMIFETYRLILNDYDHKTIGVLGVSFGATAAMTMLSWNNYYRENLSMPAIIVGLSPGHIPANLAEKEMLEAYRGIDPLISVDMVEAYGRINKGGEELDEWLIHTANGDFRNGGKIVLFFGEKESLAFAVPLYRESFERAEADYRIHVEPGMPHCYGVMRINKASRKTYDEIVDLLNGL